MPTKRRAAKGRTNRITRQAVEAFTAGDVQALHRALGLKPWHPSPLEAERPSAPLWTGGTVWATFWPEAFVIRGALLRCV